jgi:hypothetical protein
MCFHICHLSHASDPSVFPSDHHWTHGFVPTTVWYFRRACWVNGISPSPVSKKHLQCVGTVVAKKESSLDLDVTAFLPPYRLSPLATHLVPYPFQMASQKWNLSVLIYVRTQWQDEWSRMWGRVMDVGRYGEVMVATGLVSLQKMNWIATVSNFWVSWMVWGSNPTPSRWRRSFSSQKCPDWFSDPPAVLFDG